MTSQLAVNVQGLPAVVRKFAHIDRTIERARHRPVSFISSGAKNRIIGVLKIKFRYPGRPVYPLRWKSEAQRRAVMAKLRRENNLPYFRTRRLHNAWGVESDPDRLTLFNDARDPSTGQFYAAYVIGDDQQPFHADTGWKKGTERNLEDVVDTVGGILRTELVETLAEDV